MPSGSDEKDLFVYLRAYAEHQSCQERCPEFALRRGEQNCQARSC
jgi:hypothetical protein